MQISGMKFALPQSSNGKQVKHVDKNVANEMSNYLRKLFSHLSLKLKTKYEFRYAGLLAATLMFLTFLTFLPRLSLADEINLGVYSPNSAPFGTPFIDWTTKWWKWFIAIPNSQHPFADTTGERCGKSQEGPVWYLVGAGGHAERNCSIPSDKAILFPILNSECSYSESPTLKSEQELRKCAVDADKNAVLKATIDNREIKDIDRYKVTSGIFNVTYSNDPVFPTNSNVSEAVSDGWFIMLEPLKPGNHEIRFSESQIEPPSLIDVVYHLSIK
jgi:hypothetical protein